MHFICTIIFAFTVIVIANGQTSGSDTNPSNDSATEVYEFWKEQDALFQLGDQKDVVLFLGNTGSGKSATVLFVTGANLNAVVQKTPDEPVVSVDSEESVDYEVSREVHNEPNTTNTEITEQSANTETPVKSAEIFITDEHNKIGNETEDSHTLIPGLFKDESGREYYDCPGFEDTRTPKYELTIAFFLQKLMTYADSFKLVFVVSHSSLIKSEKQNEFPKLVRNAVKLIKDIEHYHDAIGLVVTKVPKLKSTLDSERLEVIGSVAKFLKEFKVSINKKNDVPNLSAEERKLNSDSVKFIDALLVMNNARERGTNITSKRYPKIRIFQKPEIIKQQFNKEESFKEDRRNLKTMINDRLKYVRKQNNDFGFVISPKSRNYVIELTNEIIQGGFGTDVARVSREIKEFYQKKESLTSDVSELYQKSKQGHELFSAIRTTDPRLFMKEILNATYVLEMAVSNNAIKPILKHIESVDFLLTVDNRTLNYQLSHKADDIVNYLKNSQNWYGFLVFLEKELTNSDFQNENMKTEARYIIGNLTQNHGNDKNDTLIQMDKIGLNPLLQKIVEPMGTVLDPITNITTYNLKALKNVLNEYSSDKLNTTCSPNNLDMEVKGHVIKMSDVTQYKCFSTAKKIKIFALNKLIVDAGFNKTGQQAQLVIIAPTWDIAANISFILDGANGPNPSNATAGNGTRSGNSNVGENGVPGEPGSAGGNFFAIGSEFVSVDQLTIQVNGGNGGAGQHGERGTLGIDGRDPPKPSSKACPGSGPGQVEEPWKQQNFTVKRDGIPPHICYYTVHGWKATRAGNGGDGGKRGDPGLAGKIVIFELGQAARLKTYRIDGAAGAIGKGGLGGGGRTHDGKTLSIVSSNSGTYGGKPGCKTTITAIKKPFDYKEYDAGKKGNDNANTLKMKHPDPPLEFDHPFYVVNEYKSFVREHSVGSTRRSKMNTFLDKMTNNQTLKAQYGALDLINEFITMENQYFHMRGKFDFIPSLESLLSRTEELATANKGKPNFVEQKRALAYLYTAILSKINGINSKVFKNTVVNFDNFLKQVNDNINILDDLTDKNNMILIREDYHSQLNEKVHSANQFIDNQITPVIKQIFEDVDKQIKDLIEASIGKQNGVLLSIEAQREARRKLEANLRLRWILAPLKVFAAAANTFGPFGVAVGSAIDGGTNVIESIALNDVGVGNVASTISKAFKDNLASIGEVLKERPKLIQEKIDYIEKYLKKKMPGSDSATEPAPKPVHDGEIKKLGAEVTRYKGEIDDLNEQLAERIKKGDLSKPKDLLKQCDEVEKNLGALIETHQKGILARLGQEKKEEEATVEKHLNTIKHVQNIAKIVDVSIETFKQISTDEAKVAAVSAAIGSLQNDLKALRDHEEKIHSVLIPEINKLEGNIDKMSDNLAGNSHVELDVKKWNIRSTLNQVRLLFKRMTTDFNSVHENLELCIDKLDEGMATLINVYDRIDSYSDSAKLAAYIQNIASHKMTFNDTELSDDVSKLQQMIQSNIVLEEYDLAMHAFKQHYFPIANSFIAQFKLPESLQMTDTNGIVKTAIHMISLGIERSKAMYNKYGHYVHSNDAFGGNTRSQPPFYTWKYHEYKDQIKDLLQGKAITIKADVTRGVNQNAVKFNYIGIRFKFSNGTAPSKLDDMLFHHFHLKMSIIGTNYYRCKNRYYQIPLDQNIDFNVRFEAKIDDKPEYPDETYAIISSNPAFLSPYTMWTMKLIGDDFNTLQPFVNQALDMELIGKGYYIEHGTLADDICTDQLDKYYRLDETISNIDTLLVKNAL